MVLEPHNAFVPGKSYKRSELHDQFGGQRQGGISTPQNAGFVMLFSSPKGEESGYADGWDDGDVYLYSGEGQHGDMSFMRGNKAIRDHEENHKTLYLFDDAGKGFWRYVCELQYLEHSIQRRPDRAGKMRNAIVFRLAVVEP
jgi:5-methylcytosine-specific restriction protein A